MKISRWQADLKPSEKEIESMLTGEGLEPVIESYSSGGAVQEHIHPFDEIRIVASGVIRYNVAGNEFLLREGDRVDLPSNTRHWMRAEGDQESISFVAHRVS